MDIAIYGEACLLRLFTAKAMVGDGSYTPLGQRVGASSYLAGATEVYWWKVAEPFVY